MEIPSLLPSSSSSSDPSALTKTTGFVFATPGLPFRVTDRIQQLTADTKRTIRHLHSFRSTTLVPGPHFAGRATLHRLSQVIRSERLAGVEPRKHAVHLNGIRNLQCSTPFWQRLL